MRLTPSRSRRASDSAGPSVGPLTWTVRGVSAVVLATILLMGALGFRALLLDASRHLDRFAVAALEEALHRPVRIGSVDVLSPGKIRVSGLAIAAGKSFRDGDLLRAPEIRVEYRLWDMLRGRVDPVGSIASVEIDSPYLLIVRTSTNHFNLQDLFPKRKKPPKPSPFRGSVTVRNGSVRFVDYATRDVPAPQTNNINAVNATLDAGSPPLMVLNATAQGDGRRAGGVRGQGTINPGTGGFAFRVQAASEDLPYWKRYFLHMPTLDVTSGSGTVTADVWKPKQFSFTSAIIQVDVRNGSATTSYTRSPLYGVQGTIAIQSGHPLNTSLDLTASTAGIPVRVYGTVLTGPNGRVALTASASQVTLPALRQVTSSVPNLKWLKPLAPATVQAQVYGPPGNLVTIGNVQVPRAKLYTSTVENVNASVRYEDHVITLPSITGTAQGHPVTAQGQINLTTKALRFVARAPSVSAASLGLTRMPITGDIASRVVVTGTTTAPRAGAVITVRNGTFRNIPFQRLAARVSVVGQTIHITDAVATVPGATIAASGTATSAGAMAMHVRAAGADLGRLLPAAGFRGITGTGFFEGSVTGTTAAPRIAGRVQVFDASVRGFPLDYAAGQVAWTPSGVRLTRVTLARYPSQATLEGTATVLPNRQVALDMNARLTSGRIEGLLGALGREPVAQGNIRSSGDILIRGTLASPDVRGSVLVTDASVQGYPVNRASGSFHYGKGLITASNIVAEGNAGAPGETSRLSVPLVRIRGEKLEAPEPFSVTNIRLDRFPGLGAPYVRLAGIVNVTGGTVEGTTRAPLVTATISLPTLSVNDIPFQNASATVSYTGNAVTVAGARLERSGQQVLSIPRAIYNEATRSISGDVRVAALKVNDIRQVLQNSNWLNRTRNLSLRNSIEGIPVQPATATVDVAGAAGENGATGTLHFTGSMRRLSLSGALAVSGLQANGQILDSVRVTGRATNLRIANGRLEAGTIDIPRDAFRAVSGDTDVKGEFQGKVGGAITAALQANYLPLSVTRLLPVARFRDPNYALHGVVTLSVNADGNWDRPHIIASVSGNDLTVGRQNIPFNVRTGAIELVNDPNGAEIVANSIRLIARDHIITAHGSVPFDWRSHSIPDNRPINANAHISEQGLDILQLVFGTGPRGPIETAKGTVVGDVTVNGMMNDPKWSGYLNVADGEVKLRALTSTLKNINMALWFNPETDAIDVQQLRIDSSSGGSITALPNGTLRLVNKNKGMPTLAPDVSLNFAAFRLEEATNGLGYGERIRGTMNTPANAPMRIERDSRGPRIAGRLILSDVDVLPPNQSPPAITSESTPSIVPSFAVTLEVGKNVWVRNALFRVKLDDRARPADRSITIAGDLQQPRIDGRLTSREGTFNYPTARFTLTDAVILVHYPTVQNVAGATVSLEEGASPITISADAQARLVASVNGRQEPVTVYLHLEGPNTAAFPTTGESAFGTLAPYRITLRSSPGLPERQLVALITREQALQALAAGTGTPEEILRQETMNILQASVLPEALSGVESRIGQAFGLESLSLDYLAMNQSVSITATKRLGNRVLLSFTRPIGATGTAGINAYTVSLSYELTNRLRLTLQQQKGPFLFGGLPTTALPTNQTSITDTQILLEGSYPF